jgi:integrase
MKRRPDGRWQKRVTLPDGTKKTLYSSAASERLATKEFNEKLLQFQKDFSSSRSFISVADQWNDEYREKISYLNYRKGPKASYERIVAHFGKTPIADIKPSDVHRYITSLINKNFSQKSVSTAKSILNMIFSFAMLNGIIQNSPVQIITLPSNLPKKARPMPDDRDIEIVNSASDGFALLPYFLLNTGLRKSEALALEYSDIDFEKKTISVNKHLLHDGNKPVMEHRTKTKSSKRTVILLDRVAEKLPKNKKGVIFCNEDGSYLTKRQYALRWEKWQKENNTTVTAHQLRHGFATMLFEAGIDLKDAQDLMGHSDIKTTQDIYTHIRDKRRKETAEKLNSFNF